MIALQICCVPLWLSVPLLGELTGLLWTAGQWLYLRKARFQCPELLFRPSLVHDHADGPGLSELLAEARSKSGVHELLYNSIMACDVGIRHQLYEAIVCSGGSTMFNGFGERLSKEIHALAPPGMRIRVIAPYERKYSVWIGGAILSSLDTFQNSWITKEEYDEAGPAAAARRCFNQNHI